MSLDFSGLGDLARQTPEQTARGWQPLTIGDLGYGTVLAFDQSLTATGCVIVAHHPRGLLVHTADKWSTKREGKDVLTSLRRGTEVFDGACTAIETARSVYGAEAVVHESPPNPQAVKGGGYSSLLAAQALHCAAWSRGVEIEMLGAQPAKKLVCGKANADKIVAHAALKEHVLPWVINSDRVTNEATRDALLIALLWLHRRPK